MSKENPTTQPLTPTQRILKTAIETTALGVVNAALRMPVTGVGMFGAEMVRGQTGLFQAIRNTVGMSKETFLSNNTVAILRDTKTFVLPFSVITNFTQHNGLTDLTANVLSTMAETAIASRPALGSEVHDRFNSSLDKAKYQIKGNAFTIDEATFNNELKKLQPEAKSQSYSFKEIEKLRTTATNNTSINFAALSIRNSAFYATLLSRSTVNKKVEKGEIKEEEKEYYIFAARTVASLFSAIPDALFTMTASGQFDAKQALKELPKMLIQSPKAFPFIPRLVVSLGMSVVTDLGLEAGSRLYQLLQDGAKTIDTMSAIDLKEVNVAQEIEEIKKTDLKDRSELTKLLTPMTGVKAAVADDLSEKKSTAIRK